MNKNLLAGVGIAVASALATPVVAQDVCGTFTVSKGQTLREIALITYGNPDDYRYIFEANRSKFGISPHIIPKGTTLDLPCRENFNAPVAPAPVEVVEASEPETTTPEPTVATPVAPQAVSEPEPAADPIVAIGSIEQPVLGSPTTDEPAAEPETVDTAEEPVAAPHSPITEIRLLGFSDNLPYSDADLLHGGLVATLIETALLRSDAATVKRPVFAARPASGLATSVVPEDIHLSFPWLKPECDLSEFDDNIKNLCENYTFSAPIFEAQMAMYTLEEGKFKDADEEIDLVGARICRPAAVETYDLLEDGMIEPIISLETASDLATCFVDLENDVVDIVSVNGLTADMYFASTARNAAIVELTALVASHTVHAIARNDSPEGMVVMNHLNIGIWDMLSDGEWGKISTDYLLTLLRM